MTSLSNLSTQGNTMQADPLPESYCKGGSYSDRKMLVGLFSSRREKLKMIIKKNEIPKKIKAETETLAWFLMNQDDSRPWNRRRDLRSIIHWFETHIFAHCNRYTILWSTLEKDKMWALTSGNPPRPEHAHRPCTKLMAADLPGEKNSQPSTKRHSRGRS